MPRLANLYFKTAICFLIIGIIMGLHMSISQDHSPVGAHAHNNLLGWVTMAIFGGYYALNPAKALTGLAMIQYWVYTGGVTVLVPSLYLLLQGNAAMEPLVALSSFVIFGGVLLFAVIIFSSSKAAAPSTALPVP